MEQIRRGNEAAFEVAFERHGPGILGFCRHMLGSREEAEDAVQQIFASAHRDLLRDSAREITLKPWLYTIARNRCLSMLRAHRELPTAYAEPPTAGLAEQVEQRAELRQLLADLRQLPDEQRAALLLAEVGDLSHIDIARVLDCEVARVKALVFRARSGLIARREARETPCESIQEQLATLRGGSLRRTELRLHLRDCVACRTYRAQVAQQRQQLAAALPVAPSLALKSSVLAAVGIGGGSAGGGGVAAGLTSIAGAFTSATGGGVLAKVAIVGVLAGSGAVAGEAVVDSRLKAAPAPAPKVAQAAERGAVKTAGSPLLSVEDKGARPGQELRSRSAGPHDQRSGPRGNDRSGRAAVPPGSAKPEQSGGQALGHGGTAGKSESSRGIARGPIDAPPASTPVRRGAPEPTPKPAPKARSAPPATQAPKVKVETPAASPPVPTPAPAPPSQGPKTKSKP